MSRFKRAIIEEDNKRNLRMRGENSHPCYNNEGFGNSLLALFDRHFQGITESDLRNKIRDILNDSIKISQEKSNNEGVLLIINLFVLCFNTRWCRGGKGAKLAFYQSIKFLFEVFPIPIIKILPLIPEFGYWKDLLLLLQHVKDFPVVGVDYTPLESAVWDLYAQQLINDYTKLIQSNNNNSSNNSTKSNIKSNLELGISSAGKYAPRENKQFDNTLHAVSQLCSRIFTESNINSFPSLSLNYNNTNNNNNTENNDDVKVAEDGINYGNNKDENEEDEDGDLIILNHEDIGLVENIKTQKPTTSTSIDNNNTSIKPMNPKKKYREIIATLNRALDVVEVKMCSNNFSSINMAAVPSRCMSLNQSAFANEMLNNEGPELKQGNRHPDNQDRIKCRQNLLKVLSSKGPGVKGSQLYPHEYVEKVLGNSKLELSFTNKLVINSQWQSMRESIEEMIKKRKENIAENDLVSDLLSDTDLNSTTTKTTTTATTNTNTTNEINNIGLGNIIPLSDVSSSMSGTPMLVAIGLGILCSELAPESFRDLVMTFSSSAYWENLSNCHNFVDKVTKLKHAHWEGSTNFYNALKQVSDIVLKNKLRQDEIPNLLVISDMQFDEAGDPQSNTCNYQKYNKPDESDDWNTVYENIERLYHNLGIKICGTPYTPPIIIFWNVRADTVGFPVTSDQKGVMMLSGYSPALMKFILSGEFEKEVIEEVPTKVSDDDDNNEDTVMITKKVKVAVSPIEVLKKVLNEDKFDCIRQILHDPSVSCYLSVPGNNLLPGNGSVSDPLFKPPKKQEFKAGVRQAVPKITSTGRGSGRGRGRGGRGMNVGGGRRGGR